MLQNKGLYEPVLYGIAAKLNIWTTDSGVQTSLSHLHGCLFILNGLLEQFDVLLHIEDLLENLSARRKKKRYMKYFALKNMQVRKEMKHFDVRVIKYVTPHSCILIFFHLRLICKIMHVLTMNAAHAFMNNRFHRLEVLQFVIHTQSINEVVTLDRWVWSLFLASVVSWILWLRATLTEFHSCHISLAHELSTLSISFLICLEAALSLWDRWMLSLLNLAQLSGTETLRDGTTKQNHHAP